MKSCSYCGLESDEAVSVCAGCGQEFTAATAPVDPVLLDSEEDLVALKRYRTVVEADMLKLRLESAGIEACVPEDLNPQLLLYPSHLAGATVRVRARDLAAAREVLADPGSPTPPPPLPPPPPAHSPN